MIASTPVPRYSDPPKLIKFMDNVGADSVMPSGDNSTRYEVGSMNKGTWIMFVLHNSGSWGCDATFVRWRLTLTP